MNYVCLSFFTIYPGIRNADQHSADRRTFLFYFIYCNFFLFAIVRKADVKMQLRHGLLFHIFFFLHQLLSHFPLFLYHLFLRNVLDVRLVDGVSHSGHLVQVQRPVWIIQRWFPLLFKIIQLRYVYIFCTKSTHLALMT